MGTGIAVDASCRGYKVALIEAEDFASETSGKSTKLVHGGVRYLEKAFKDLDYHQYTLVHEALHERNTFLSNAPHLARELPIIIPFYRWIDKFYYGLGVKVYEWMAGKNNIGRGEFLSANEVKKRLPHLKGEGLKGGVTYYDGQFDDNRMNVSLALTALENGSVVVNYTEFVDFIKENSSINGVEARDKVSGKSFSINAKVVINATGPFTDAIRRKDQQHAEPVLQGSSGTHILLDKEFTPQKTGMLIPKTEDGRVLFLLPWQGGTLLGTTDDPCEIQHHPIPHKEDIEYLLEHMNRYLDRQLSSDDVLASWTGIRPLIKESGVSTTEKISRDFQIELSESGLYSIYGGKWTLYRKMAEDLVDRVIYDGVIEGKGPSVTATTKIVGGEGYSGNLVEQLKGIDPDVKEHLTRSYGDRADKVMEYVRQGYGERLVEEYPFLEAEVLYSKEYELAQTPEDILQRRMSLGLLDEKATQQAYPRVAVLMDSTSK